MLRVRGSWNKFLREVINEGGSGMKKRSINIFPVQIAYWLEVERNWDSHTKSETAAVVPKIHTPTAYRTELEKLAAWGMEVEHAAAYRIEVELVAAWSKKVDSLHGSLVG